MDDSSIVFEDVSVSGGVVGKIILNRPKALNALTMQMMHELNKKLQCWQAQENILFVTIEGAGERAFCSGGDIKFLYDYGLSDAPEMHNNFHLEYSANQTIFHFTKPYISFLDGIVMGGGAGVSVHGSHRVATENIVFAMPETHIGFFPDVGMCYHFSRMHGAVGMYLALTGASLTLADSMRLELTTHSVASEQLVQLKSALFAYDYRNKNSLQAVDSVLKKYSQPLGDGELLKRRAVIDECFSQKSLSDIFQALKYHPDPWTKEVLEKLNKLCPMSLAVTFEHVMRCAQLDFNQVLAQDLRLANVLCSRQDLHEGIKAAIIDKKHQPGWSPAKIDDVSRSSVNKLFSI